VGCGSSLQTIWLFVSLQIKKKATNQVRRYSSNSNLEAFLFLAHLTVLYMFCTVHNVICEFGTCIVMSLNRTHVKDKMRTCKGECAQFSFSKCPIDSHGGAGAEI
jgi:hypothetical protein